MQSSDLASQPPAAHTSLRAAYPGLWKIPALLALTGLLLILGQVLPGVTIQTLGHEPDRYSVFGGVADLWRGNNKLLASILFCFSILFPTIKFGALLLMWFKPMQPQRRANLAHWLKPLGKWSMLDGFVVIALVGTVQLRGPLLKLATANPEPAVYLFSLAILLSITLSFFIARLSDDQAGGEHYIPRPDLTMVLAPWGAAACLVAGLLHPILMIEKKMFTHIYDLPVALGELLDSGEHYLVALFAFFVVLLPMVYFVGLGVVAICQGLGKDASRALSVLVAVERWAMLDVFSLGVLLVYNKVGGFTTVSALPGFWLILASAVLSIYCAFRVRRVY